MGRDMLEHALEYGSSSWFVIDSTLLESHAQANLGFPDPGPNAHLSFDSESPRVKRSNDLACTYAQLLMYM